MAAEHGTPERPPSPDDGTWVPPTRVELEDRTEFDDADAASSPPPSSLPYRIERTYLRARIAALERELAASASRRQAIRTQYELILDQRPDADRADSDRSTGRDRTRRRGLLGRLFDRGR